MWGGRASARGFTLIEIVTAFAILALGTALAIPAFMRMVEEDELTRSTRTVQTLFKIARDSAIAAGRPVTVVLDSVTGLVWLDVPPRPGEDSYGVGAGTFDMASLDLPGGVTMDLPAARTRFTFAPSGQAFGDYIRLSSPLGERLVTLDRWTGDVVVR